MNNSMYVTYSTLLPYYRSLYGVAYVYWDIELRYRYIDGLVQDCGISIANALEIPQSSTKLSI